MTELEASCSTCWHRRHACRDSVAEPESCNAYEHRLDWIARQLNLLRRADFATRIGFAFVVLLFPFLAIAVWLTLTG